MERGIKPNYHKIYKDLIEKKYPEKEKKCIRILSKKELSAIDVIELSQIIFNTEKKEEIRRNQKHRSYDRSAILQMLNYQKENGLNNTELAKHFSLSRNSVAKWKKIFYRSVDN
ncbi:helix-turn-helix domain-containing protein [Chryseobacterium daecheongense]|uniref:Helix-turn-helix domain-containing protein n=1 Tax=Chryseobacterium daecheongense TaxID=192389 RepID=A0A3N0VY80_9FLAO|nr:helix-turn-helix domain-containing protein [Chryseobacterium daecheongense]ROH97697.1 helix-turn-helix domain-containing protein [Chryseobacterium daecheongense]TDX93143.1 hypothetical protein BCF50_2100 [Chryseobacterium daecheongense]